ncbi:chaperonin 11 [Dunaliella salina]|uniref:Chaperonin 11 n=1 Tax=Dunaliella salina TaxID=3046 RepID=A0ABQ7G8J0_DUNSA|nr:chaperonin 11 [Dunaliella salina]|eukprot:KAF5830926.1 chaperonin 11 [Dunaliella salina]
MALLASRSPCLTTKNVRQHAPSRGAVSVRASVTADRAALDLSKMAPIHDRVLIKPLEEEQRTAGGILLPKGPPKANSDAHYGEVLAIGDKVELPLKVGDFVTFQKYAMAEVEVKDGAVLFVAQKSIMGKLE